MLLVLVHVECFIKIKKDDFKLESTKHVNNERQGLMRTDFLREPLHDFHFVPDNTYFTWTIFFQLD